MQLPQPTCDVGRECMEILKNNSGRSLQDKININVVDKWLYLYKPQVFNKKVPNILRKYKGLRGEVERQRFNAENKDWITSNEMVEYAKEQKRVDTDNQRHYEFLKEVHSEVDLIRQEKIEVVLASYPAVKEPMATNNNNKKRVWVN